MIGHLPNKPLLARLRDWRKRVRGCNRKPPTPDGGGRHPGQTGSWSEALRFPPF